MRIGIIAASLLLAANAQAAIVYEFVQDETGDTLAYWALAKLPAGHQDVVGLAYA